MKRILRKNSTRNFRKVRNRAKMKGTEVRPRLSIFRSNAYTYAQLIDDDARTTLVSASTKGEKGKKAVSAISLGTKIAEAAQKKGIKKVVFDRGHYAYHGRVKAVAEAARSGGLEF